jgi:hypothetical protein
MTHSAHTMCGIGHVSLAAYVSREYLSMQKQQMVRRRAPQNRRRGNGTANAGALSHPPQIRPAISGSKTFRFQGQSSQTNQAITQANLLDMLVMALSSTTTALLFNSVRLRKVEMWVAPAQGSGGAVLACAGTVAGPTNRKSDASMGVTPAHVKWNPAPNSISDLWYEAGSASQSLFTLTYVADAIVDVTIDYIIACDDTAIAGPVPAGATPGTIYGVSLDGISSNQLQPVDYAILP